MSVAEPPITSVPTGRPGNPYEGRWRWWYSAISDWMIRNPGGKIPLCAAELGKSPNTIYLISETDMFRDFHAQRLRAWRETHDFSLRSKLTSVAEASLDILLEKLEEKGKQVPFRDIKEIATSSLEKLGFGAPTQGGVTVNVQQNDNRQQVVIAPATVSELEEARMALRTAESRRLAPPTVRCVTDGSEREAEQVDPNPTKDGSYDSVE